MSNFTGLCLIVLFNVFTVFGEGSSSNETKQNQFVNAHTQLDTPPSFFSLSNYEQYLLCDNQHVMLSNQSEVDNFSKNYPDCNIIESLEINGDDITNLEGLSEVQEITKYLSIKTTSLEDFSGLSRINLTAIDYLIIKGNHELKTLDGLTCGSSIKHLSVRKNESLEDVDGLLNLNKVGYFYLSKNKNLLTLTGLRNIEKIDRFSLYENGSLQNLEGLENLKSVITLSLNENHNLFNIDALSNLTDYTLFFVYNNCSLADCCGVIPAFKEQGSGKYVIVSSNSVGCGDNKEVAESCEAVNDYSTVSTEED